MKKASSFGAATFVCALLALATVTMGFQEKEAKGHPGLKDTTIFIIRHAEKPTNGFILNEAGVKRAAAYPGYFKTFTLDGKPLKLEHLFATADSKNSHRPRLTIESLGTALGLPVDDRFANKKFQDLVDELQAKEHGKQILICWHHGEIPELAGALGADVEKLLPGGKWPENVFCWMLELRYDHEGKLIPGETKVVNEKLMPGDETREPKTGG